LTLSGYLRCCLVAISLASVPHVATLAEEDGAVQLDGLTPVTEGAALKDLLSDMTLYGIFPQDGNLRWSEYYCPNGRALYTRELEAIRGRWWIAAPQMCFQYETPDSPGAYCFDTFAHRDGSYHLRDSDYPAEGIIVIVQGRIKGDAFGMQRVLGMSCQDLSS
jgi:hypothetical protein